MTITFKREQIVHETTSCKVACDGCGKLASEQYGLGTAIGEALLAGWRFRLQPEDLPALREAWVYPLAEPIEWPCVCPGCVPTWASS